MEDRQVGGFGFVIGNAALFLNGLIAQLHATTPQSRQAGAARMLSSGLWAASGMFLAHYGDRSVADQQARLEEKLAAYLQQHQVPLDAASLCKADAEARHGWFQKLEDFFYAHPIECTNAYYTAASAGFAVSGTQRQRDGNVNAGNANLGTSGLVLTGALASILIPEKTPEQIAAQGQSGTVWGDVQKQPLHYVRWLFLAADAMAGLEALGEYQAARALPKGHAYRPWQFGMAGLSLVAMGTMMAGDWLTSGSKKAGGAPAARSDAQQAILQGAACHLAQLPKAHQAALVDTVAAYLTHQHELRFQDQPPEKIADGLLRAIEQLAEATPNTSVHQAVRGARIIDAPFRHAAP